MSNLARTSIELGLSVLAAYTATAFTLFDANPSHWGELARILTIAMAAMGIWCSTGYRILVLP